MRHFSILILSILSIQLSYSQINEVGIFAGGSNFIGDIGATNHISPEAPTLGLLYKWNASPRHSWRASVIYSELNADDNSSEDPRRLERGYNFESNFLEISAGMEFNFIDFNLHHDDKIISPYLYSGISAANHDNYYYPNNIQEPENTKSWAFGIPMALGIKTNVLGNILLGIEIGARYTFSDSLEGSVPDDSSLRQFQFGNINNNDWYVFSGITLTYTFGTKPCYCID